MKTDKEKEVGFRYTTKDGIELEVVQVFEGGGIAVKVINDTPTDTETNYLLQGKNGERLRESIEQTKDKATFLKADLTIGGIYQILGQFGEEHEPIKKKFREYCETLTKNQK